MKEQNKELLYLDGMWLRQEHLLNLAMGVGNYAQAEHYLFALLADAVVKGKREAILEVNKVREHYGVKAIPLSDDDLEDDDDLQGKTRLTAADEQAKKLFLKMTREEKHFVTGASPRAVLALVKASQAKAFIDGRDYVRPDDVKAAAPYVLSHRLTLTSEAKIAKENKDEMIAKLIQKTKIPM